jgi:dTDP-4-dehydrorhamnose reductase
MRLLVTGGSGLLGSRVVAACPEEWGVTATYGRRPVDGLIPMDLDVADSVEGAVLSGDYDWVVHCAAIRSPEQCMRDPVAAMRRNATAVAWVARAAARTGVRVAYASTDYVFPGDDPPYAEGAPPFPLNLYGHTKLAGEGFAMAVPGGLIVRMPMLFSTDLSAPNNIVADLRDAASAGRPTAADTQSVRYPTLAEDVAAAFVFLLGRDCQGIVHVSSEEPCTKLAFLRAAAEAAGVDPAMVVEQQSSPARADRPVDSHLDTSLYRSLGGPPFKGYAEALRAVETGRSSPLR